MSSAGQNFFPPGGFRLTYSKKDATRATPPPTQFISLAAKSAELELGANREENWNANVSRSIHENFEYGFG